MDNLQQLQIISDSGLLILIWLVQIIIYPSFQYIEEEHFIEWHRRYTAMIGIVVTPLMLLQIGVEGVFFLQQDLRWQRVVFITTVWLSTFLFSVPCHSQLHRSGKNITIIKRLVLTNWLRTFCWSILFLDTLTLSENIYIFNEGVH